jgi:D-alanyl-D-alanine dipeptidase
MTRPFTTEDFARCIERAEQQAVQAGLTGVLVASGPDLVYFIGYTPIAITERITIEDIVVATEDGGGRLNNTNYEMYIVS